MRKIHNSEKVIVGVLAVVAAEIVLLGWVFPGWAMVPPRLNTVSAVLAPLGHLGMKAGFPDGLNAVLAVGTFPLLGAYWTWSWIRDRATKALWRGGWVYGSAVALALWLG